MVTRAGAHEVVSAVVQAYYAKHGQYVETLAQELVIAELSVIIDKRVKEGDFTDALAVLQRQYEFDNADYLPDGDRAHDQAKLAEELTAAIDRITGR